MKNCIPLLLALLLSSAAARSARAVNHMTPKQKLRQSLGKLWNKDHGRVHMGFKMPWQLLRQATTGENSIAFGKYGRVTGKETVEVFLPLITTLGRHFDVKITAKPTIDAKGEVHFRLKDITIDHPTFVNKVERIRGMRGIKITGSMSNGGGGMPGMNM